MWDGRDWLDDLEARRNDAHDEQAEEAQRAALIRENVSSLWKTFHNHLTAESERYNARFPASRIAIKPHGEPAQFMANTTGGKYPSVSLKVTCCEPDGRNFTYIYRITKNYDVPEREEQGRFIVDCRGDSVFLKTPEGIPLHPKEAATWLLERVVDPSMIA